jgi:hypothetical protein
MCFYLFIDEMRKYRRRKKYESLLRGGSCSYLIPLLSAKPRQGKIDRKYNPLLQLSPHFELHHQTSKSGSNGYIKLPSQIK